MKNLPVSETFHAGPCWYDKWERCGCQIKSVKVILGNIEHTKERKSKSRFQWDSSYDSNVQYNLNGSNPDGSFTLDDSNLFSVPTKSFQ